MSMGTRTRIRACVDAMRKIAGFHGSTVARIALAWVLSKNFVTGVIMGASNLNQLEDNLGATNVSLSAAEADELDAISELPPEHPGWMNFQDEERIPKPFVRSKAPLTWDAIWTRHPVSSSLSS